MDASHSPPARIPRILIVDNARHLLHSFVSALHDYNVVVASSGALALFWIAEQPDIDLVLCDLHLPDLPGRDFYHLVCARWPALRSRVVFMTDDDANPCSLDDDTSAVPVLSKPFEPALMRAAVQDLLSRLPPVARS